MPREEFVCMNKIDNMSMIWHEIEASSQYLSCRSKVSLKASLCVEREDDGREASPPGGVEFTGAGEEDNDSAHLCIISANKVLLLPFSFGTGCLRVGDKMFPFIEELKATPFVASENTANRSL